MLETFCLSVLGSGGVAGIFFALIRHYIERRLMEVEAREQERIKYKIEQRKADEEITHPSSFAFPMIFTLVTIPVVLILWFTSVRCCVSSK